MEMSTIEDLKAKIEELTQEKRILELEKEIEKLKKEIEGIKASQIWYIPPVTVNPVPPYYVPSPLSTSPVIPQEPWYTISITTYTAEGTCEGLQL